MALQRRLAVISRHLDSTDQPDPVSSLSPSSTATPQPNTNTLTVTDHRTGKTVQFPIQNRVVRALDFKKLKTPEEEKEGREECGIVLYDSAFQNTAVTKSKITFIDGDQGILRYRGYPIQELAEKSNFLEVAFLLINGSLPHKSQMERWRYNIMTHTYLHENLVDLMKTFRYDAHPMGMLISSIAALGTFYPEANPALQGLSVLQNERVRNKQIYRLIGKVPTIAACAYRHRIGRPYNEPSTELDYTANFLYMLDKLSTQNYKPHPSLVRALDVMFILHADHELNCSTAAMRHVSSSGTDPYTSVAAAAGALYGPLHGGANEAVLNMLESIGSIENVPLFIQDVKAKKKKLMGFGHRVYKNYDPRAKIIRTVAYEVFDILGKEPLIEVATELEKQALSDEYFISRKLYPNVDFYSGLIYKAMGFPTDMFPVLFTIPRVVGWLAHWLESMDDEETRIFRPRQVYIGEEERPYVPLEMREMAKIRIQDTYSSGSSKRTTTKR